MKGGSSRQFPLHLPHHPSLTRDDLIVTDANAMAVAAVDAWPEWQHPVTLVVGPEGAGKSHLAAAWREMAGAIDFDGRLPEERRFAVVVDDLDNWDGAEERLFDLLNAARLGGGFVLATARRRPTEMSFRLPDLLSRLRAATLTDIAPPDEDLLRGVLAKLFADRQLAVEPKLIDYLADRMERSLAAARRLVDRIDQQALADKARVTRGLIGRVLAEEESGDAERLS
ncbi:P-loop NTPase family protein [Aureimonas psammosilenae]|uniref:DnaA ATPase domain-containing protein n=1 Tax=Aureimonas psammosilenae TaxID=2495496 RepID=UPI001260AE30|nr:DnaA/Hda family protein [Aureimonas psammosilenae]